MNSPHTRRVHTLRLRAPDDALIRRGALLLEDALHTASLLDGEGGRLLIVRRLAVGKIQRQQSPNSLALTIEERMRHLQTTAVHAESPGAASQPVVYFQDEVEPYVSLALRLARGITPPEWFWPLAVRGWQPTQAHDQALRQLLFQVIQCAARAGAALRMVDTLARHQALAPLLASLQPQDGAMLLQACGLTLPAVEADQAIAPTVSARMGHEGRTIAPLAQPLPGQCILPPSPLQTLLTTWGAAWGAQDMRTIWLAAMALASKQPGRLHHPALTSQAQRLIRQVVPSARVTEQARPNHTNPSAHTANPSGAVAVVTEPGVRHVTVEQGAPPQPHQSTSGATTAIEQRAPQPVRHPIAVAAKQVIPTAPSTVSAPAQPLTPAPVFAAAEPSSGAAEVPADDMAAQPLPIGEYSAYAGFYFLLPMLHQLGWADWLRAWPPWIDVQLPVRLLLVVGERLGIPAGDAVLRPLDCVEEIDATPTWPFAMPPRWVDWGLDQPISHLFTARQTELTLQAAVDAWIDAIERWCRTQAGLTLAELICRPGWVTATPTHLDLTFALRQVDIRVRRAGLDLNPGWVAWLGRVVYFHYVAHVAGE